MPRQLLRCTVTSSRPRIRITASSTWLYNSTMLDSTKFLLFLTAALLLAIAPGPGMLYVLARSLAGGKREGILSAIGTFLGGMAHVLAAALGVSIILAKSAAAFATVKYVGAAYLCFLGIRMILDARRENPDAPEVQLSGARPAHNPLWQGVATEVLNPKTALFFLSFIPQFVNRASGHVFLQFVALGTISVVMNTTADLLVIALAGPLGNRIRSSATFRRRQRTLTGAIMIGLGTYLATGESK
jgi:threonine/homoserine/homoserine lactone efflux protein